MIFSAILSFGLISNPAVPIVSLNSCSKLLSGLNEFEIQSDDLLHVYQGLAVFNERVFLGFQTLLPTQAQTRPMQGRFFKVNEIFDAPITQDHEVNLSLFNDESSGNPYEGTSREELIEMGEDPDHLEAFYSLPHADKPLAEITRRAFASKVLGRSLDEEVWMDDIFQPIVGSTHYMLSEAWKTIFTNALVNYFGESGLLHEEAEGKRAEFQRIINNGPTDDEVRSLIKKMSKESPGIHEAMLQSKAITSIPTNSRDIQEAVSALGLISLNFSFNAISNQHHYSGFMVIDPETQEGFIFYYDKAF